MKRRSIAHAMSLASILAMCSGTALAAEPDPVVQPAAGFQGPTLTAAFSGPNVAENATTSITLTITNPNPSQTLHSVAFTASVQLGHLQLTSGTRTACNGTLTVTAPTSITLSGAYVQGSTSGLNVCAIHITATAVLPGHTAVNTSQITSTEGMAPGNPTTATIQVLRLPKLTAAFDTASVPVGTVDHITFKLSTSSLNSVTVGQIGFTLNLPAGLVAAPYSIPNFSCGHGSLTATASTFTVSNFGLGSGIECDFGADITGTAPGTYTLTTSAVSSDVASGPAASTTVTITAAPAPAKTAAPAAATPPAATPTDPTSAASDTPLPSDSAATESSAPSGIAMAVESVAASGSGGVSGSELIASARPSGDGSSPLVFVLIGLVVALGLGGLAAFLFFRRRRGAAEASPPPAG